MFRLLKDNRLGEDELEIASRNLPNNLFLKMKLESCYNFIQEDDPAEFIIEIVPYTSDRKTDWNHPLKKDFKAEHTESNCVVFPRLIVENCYFIMDEIPKKYEFLDVYVRTTNEKPSWILTRCEFGIRDEEDNDYYFTYEYENTNSFQDMFFGTIARVTNGWKFYPAFEECCNNIYDTVTEKYKKRKRGK